MNYNRPAFAAARVWNDHDQYRPWNKRGDSDRIQRRYERLDARLLAYEGNDARLLRARERRIRNEALSNRDQAWAFERLRRPA